MFGTPEQPGIVPRTVEQIFSTINCLTTPQNKQDNNPVNSDVIFLVKMSYVELYNNTFRSLLNDPPASQVESSSPTKYKRDLGNKIEGEKMRGRSDELGIS